MHEGKTSVLYLNGNLVKSVHTKSEKTAPEKWGQEEGRFKRLALAAVVNRHTNCAYHVGHLCLGSSYVNEALVVSSQLTQRLESMTSECTSSVLKLSLDDQLTHHVSHLKAQT